MEVPLEEVRYRDAKQNFQNWGCRFKFKSSTIYDDYLEYSNLCNKYLIVQIISIHDYLFLYERSIQTS